MSNDAVVTVNWPDALGTKHRQPFGLAEQGATRGRLDLGAVAESYKGSLQE